MNQERLLQDTLLSGNNISIFGCGEIADKFLYKYKHKIHIQKCFDNYSSKSTFCNIKLEKPNPINTKDTVIIITSNYYNEISDQLKGYGLKEFEDFIGYQFLDKKIAILHGNCHIDIIKKFLKSSEDFNAQYAIYDIPAIYEEKMKKFDRNVLKFCDLYIHQEIRENNEFGSDISDSYMESFLSPSCIKLIIPNLYHFGKYLFPQFCGYQKNRSARRNENGRFPHRDENIDKFYKLGFNAEEIKDKICSGLYSKNYIHEEYEMTIQKLKRREKTWDIKIVDFILDNNKYHKLFYDAGHPSNVILKEISLRILKSLNIRTSDLTCDTCLDAFEMPVYPCVKSAFSVKWDDSVIRKSGLKLIEDEMDLLEYIKEYLYWMYII